MQEKNPELVKNILNQIVKHANVKGYSELAQVLGESTGRIYGWIRNGRISDTGSILTKFPEISRDWIRSGDGPMLSIGNDRKKLNKEQKIVMTIEPGPARKKGSIKTEEQQARQETEAIDEDEAIEQTRYVLRSDTVYRGALVSNIRAFYQGVRREEEMAGVDEQMIEMQNKMDMMMQMLESLGAHLPGKKRDAQEG